MSTNIQPTEPSSEATIHLPNRRSIDSLMGFYEDLHYHNIDPNTTVQQCVAGIWQNFFWARYESYCHYQACELIGNEKLAVDDALPF